MSAAASPFAPELRPYQTEGADWIVARLQANNRAVLLCDDPGLGKTRQILRAREIMGPEDDTLIIAPAGARHVWANEIIKWYPAWRRQLLVIEPGTPSLMVEARLARPPWIIVLGVDTLPTTGAPWRNLLRKTRGKLLVIDEAHYLKNLSLRTEMIYGRSGSTNGLQANFDKAVLASGTITPNHAGEFYQHVRTFWPHTITVMTPKGDRVISEGEFQERFTTFRVTPYGRQITGSQNQHVLRQRLGHVVLRRRKSEVLTELPPLQTQDIPLDVRALDRKTYLTDDVVHAATPLQAIVNSAYLTRDRDLISLMQSETTSLATVRRCLGELKVDATVQWVNERLACGATKMLIFGWHIQVLTRLHRLLAEYDPVLVTGQTSPHARRDAETLFQTRPNVRVFIGQILACGHAITLTAASEVAIIEPSWVPSQNNQAISRAHRMGQRDSVLASFLYVPRTIDEHVMKAFRRKADEISILMGDEHDDARGDHPGPGGPGSPGAGSGSDQTHAACWVSHPDRG